MADCASLVRALADPDRDVAEEALRTVARTDPDGDEILDAVMAARAGEPLYGLWADALVALCTRNERARGHVRSAVVDPDEQEIVPLVRGLTDRRLDFALVDAAAALRAGSYTTEHDPRWVCRYLLDVGGADGANAVAALLDGRHYADVAAEELARVRDPRALDRLLARFRAGEYMVAWDLGRLGDPGAVPALCEELTRSRAHPSHEATWRHWIAGALADIGDPSALAALYRVRVPGGRSDVDAHSVGHSARAAVENAIDVLESADR